MLQQLSFKELYDFLVLSLKSVPNFIALNKYFGEKDSNCINMLCFEYVHSIDIVLELSACHLNELGNIKDVKICYYKVISSENNKR